MYHRVAAGSGDALTVTPEQLADQLRWLDQQGFHFVTATQVLGAAAGGKSLPAWPVLITFDDAYVDTLEQAQPVLARLGVPAIVFVPTAFVGRTNVWDGGDQPLLSVAQLREIAVQGLELGLHSHRHVNYAQLTPGKVAEDVRESLAAFTSWSLPVVPALAYPYGRRPDGSARAALPEALRALGCRPRFASATESTRGP
jgi:peptidoglycan/xylan/chitin deacetylase (PgdA/CDA1 family)